MMNVFEWVFWLSVAAVVMITIGYPLFIGLVSPFVRKRTPAGGIEPRVTLIIAAYNEEKNIGAKLENSLLLDYPGDKLEIIVASDGSSDGTNRIVEEFGSRGVRLAAFPRTGKTGCQNRVARMASGDILVFSDANAAYDRAAIRMLVRNFADPAIGGVCGQLNYQVEGGGAGASEDAYWKYEKFIKSCESNLSSVLGANGSIYAVRKAEYVELPEDLISDFVEPLAVVRNGHRFVYEPEAVSTEESSGSYGGEYRRKVRILTRSIRGLLFMSALLNPFRYGVFALQLIMHKLLRFLTPLFLISGALALVALGALGAYRWLLVCAAAGTAIAALVATREGRARANIFVRLCNFYFYYLMANYALVLAWRNVLRGTRMTLWSPERKGA
jgi:cellulose synthase/poly-beta-1,6-N-acetylglucosamine synthase-like glycosyltransferase